jgi:hypothetical protein
MNPKVLVAILALVNLLAGVGLGVALDRYALPCPRSDGANEAQANVESRRGPGHWKKGRSRKDRMQRRMTRLIQDLDLDADQVPKVQAVFESRRPKFMAVFAEVRPRLEALELETHAELSEVLRPEQQEKLEELRKSFEGRGPWGRGRSSRHKRDADQPTPNRERKQ